MLEEFFKNTEFAPPVEAFVNCIPVAVFLREAVAIVNQNESSITRL